MINFDLCINTVDLRFQIYFSVDRIQSILSVLKISIPKEKIKKNTIRCLVDQSIHD